MAISSPQDVVNNPQSMEAQPVDITGNNDATAHPFGANENALSSDTTHNHEAFPPTKINGVPNQKSSSEMSESQAGGLAENIGDGDANHTIKTDVNVMPEDNQENEAFEVGSFKSGGFEGSLGSDDETNKAGAAGNGKDTIPRYTTKKPAGFKPVSVTKSFLAKAGAPVLPLKTGADKGVSSPGSPAPGSATSLTRPRLVAKTLSSSRTAAPKSLGSSFKQAGADGPDPNQVWNRNRVQMAPQATPKHMTDEELRQQYGIQLASRPLEGGDSNQAKWADLEDEDEDWAPETLEWSDGTKINLAPAEPATPANITTDATITQQIQSQAVTEKAPSTPKISLGPKATVLKLGGGANSTKPSPVAPGSLLSQKSSNDKPTLVAKPSPAPPAKSPWAQLPPVEKVSPIVPPTQISVSRFSHREGYNRDSMPSQHSQPTREIAADDYSRFPANGTPRELFNSHSGRYEPAPESRRLSMKKEGGFRAPAVLQRPSQNDINSTADSMSLNQNRSAQDPATWKHRRTSSNVSNDSGPLARRMSINRQTPDAFGRRGSVHGQAHPENRVGSPAVSHGFSAESQPSPMADHAAMIHRPDQHPGNQLPGTPATPGNLDVELARQKKLMRERAEAAIQRRKDEEAKEEAEKRERLRLKLQELEPKAAPVAEPSVQQPTQSTTKESLQVAEEKAKSTSPPKPPAPSIGGEPQQYGLMKLHGNTQPSSNMTSDSRLSQISPPQDLTPRNDAHRPQEAAMHSRPLTTGYADGNLMSKPNPASIGHQFERENHPSHGHRLPSQSSAWGQTGMNSQSTPIVNVWGAPGSQKSLGNGDFQKNVNPIHLPQATSQQYAPHIGTSQTQPPPIGTPRQLAQHHTNQAQMPLEHQNLPHQFSADIPIHPAQSRTHAPLPGMAKDSHTPVNLPSSAPSQPPGISAWTDFAKNAPAYDAQKKAQIAHESATLAAERERAGLPTNQAPTMHETWTQITRGDAIGNRRPVNTTMSHRDFTAGDSIIPSMNQSSQMRSRYKDLFDQNERSTGSFIRPNEPLTPPPEEGDHPVFFGGAQKPKVRLPGTVAIDTTDKPIPIVRLPLAEAYISKTNFRTTVQSPRLPLSPLRHQPLVNNASWQERFNGLLGNDTRAQKRPVEIPGFSTSKEPFEYLQIPRTSVLLPLQDHDIVETIETKSFEEEAALMEEGRDFGSVPPVRIPIQVPIEAWNPPKPFKDLKRIRAAILSDEQVHGYAMFSPFDFLRSGETSLSVKLPLMNSTIRVPYTRVANTRQRSSFQASRGGKSRNTNGQHVGTHKPRENSAAGVGPPAGTPHASGRNSNHASGARKPSGHGHSANWTTGGKRPGPAPATVH